MGTKFLAWLGAVAAFLAVAYFLKYSIDHGFIPPVVRAATGFVFGAGLIVGGVFATGKKYPVSGHALCAAGVVSLYGVTFACRALYHFPFFGVAPTFALMALITMAAFTLAVRLHGKFIAILGLLGGFATPALLSTGVDNPAGLFGYIALLNIGLYAVALRRRWDFLVLLGALGTACVQVGWASAFPAGNGLTAMVVCLVFDALFLAGYCVARRWRREGAAHARGVAGLVLVSFGFALWLGGGGGGGLPVWGLPCFVFLADACVLAVVALDWRGGGGGGVVVGGGNGGGGSRRLHAVAWLGAFVVLAAWTLNARVFRVDSLPWALAAYFVFAVLHTAFPLLLARARARQETGGGGVAAAGTALQFFAPLALVLVLVIGPMRGLENTWLVWPAILLIDFVAIVCAAVTRALAGVVVSLVLTLVSAAVWLCKVPAATTRVPVSLLLVAGGFAVLFFAASLWIARRRGGAGSPGGAVGSDGAVGAGKESGARGAGGTGGASWAGGAGDADAGFRLALPALSSLLPFVLIVMMEARLALADPTPMFGLGLLLTALTLGLAKFLKNDWLPACALAGVLAVCYAWQASGGGGNGGGGGGVFFGAEQQIAAAATSSTATSSAAAAAAATTTAMPAAMTAAFGWCIGFYVIFTAFPFVFRRDFWDTRGAWIASAACGALFFPLVYWMIKTFWPNDVMGLVPAAFAVPALACLVAVLRLDAPEHPLRMGRLALFGGAALLFITLVFPIQFSREWVTIAWALEGAALLWLFTRVPHRALPRAGAGLLAVAFARLALNPAVLGYHTRGDMPVLNWYLYAYGIAIACLFGGARFLRMAGREGLAGRKEREEPAGRTGRENRENKFAALAAKILPALGAVLAFLLLNIEIADFFTEPGSRALALEFSGNFARDMSYTIAWALFALALLAAGIWRRLRLARYAALALLAVVALKLFLHDLASLETLYRVGAFFGVATVMIFASFLYQKYIVPHNSGGGSKGGSKN
ncbi:MAG: DUF2339 domain-containing protein [Opitutaceae bacterium]|nr:DUF2339 domain-containing protein [Opitutaceae bacterium]